MIISINGMDNSGKTTQAKRLVALYPETFKARIHIADTPSFDKQRFDYNWWFKQSTPDEFVHTMYQCIKERIEMAKALDEDGKIIIIEKGLHFYDARINSTLLAKGLTVKDALALQKKIRGQYDLEDVEELKFFLNPGPYRRESDLDNNPEYQEYLLNTELFLLVCHPDYIGIDYGGLDDVTNRILNEIERRTEKSGKKRVLSRNTSRV